MVNKKLAVLAIMLISGTACAWGGSKSRLSAEYDTNSIKHMLDNFWIAQQKKAGVKFVELDVIYPAHDTVIALNERFISHVLGKLKHKGQSLSHAQYETLENIFNYASHRGVEKARQGETKTAHVYFDLAEKALARLNQDPNYRNQSANWQASLGEKKHDAANVNSNSCKPMMERVPLNTGSTMMEIDEDEMEIEPR